MLSLASNDLNSRADGLFESVANLGFSGEGATGVGEPLFDDAWRVMVGTLESCALGFLTSFARRDFELKADVVFALVGLGISLVSAVDSVIG